MVETGGRQHRHSSTGSRHDNPSRHRRPGCAASGMRPRSIISSRERTMIQDAQGQWVTGATATAVALYDSAARAMTLACGEVIGLFDQARTAAPDFVMAHL